MIYIDLNLAKVIHEKWKESVMKQQRQEEVSCGKLMQGKSHGFTSDVLILMLKLGVCVYEFQLILNILPQNMLPKNFDL